MRIVFYLLMFFPLFSFGQEKKEIIKSAVLIAHADFSDFSLLNSNGIDGIINQYKVRDLKSSMPIAYNCHFLEVSPLYCWNCENCKMLIAYWERERRFFRLKGFRYSEFSQFFNFVLLKKGMIKNTNKNRKLIFEDFLIEDYELPELYKSYYDKKGRLSIDTTSCFLRSRIVIY
ncbi:MAG: hypothetical protein GX259_09855 [Bacteroidales bacterium]|nr:hypothetical protein [Bacteroidales bacterium]